VAIQQIRLSTYSTEHKKARYNIAKTAMGNMKGVILAGGTGSRLHPLTKTTNKHILPVYNKPMIFYPLHTLKQSGIDEILIISGPEHAGEFLEMLGSGYDLGLSLSYTIQEKPLGIAHAIWVAQDFADGEDIAVILGDNIFADSFEKDVHSFEGGAKLFLQDVETPSQFGVPKIVDNEIEKIIEKPDDPPSNLAVIGAYLYDNCVFDYIEELELSDRNELEVSDLNQKYLENGELEYRELNGYWYDAGTFEGLFKANQKLREEKLNGNERGINIEDTDWGRTAKFNWDIDEEEI
jgi:glucose-1-phosphate thymidylyltransferase